MTMRCNYHCSYCCYANCLESGEWSREILMRNIDWIIRDGQTDRIIFFGGEPLIHPHILEAVAKCKSELPCQLVTVSNGSMPLQFFHKLYAIDPDFRTVISLHFEKLNPDSFLEKAAFLAETRKGAKFKIMFHPQYRDVIFRLADDLERIIAGTKSALTCAMIRFPEDKYVKFSEQYTQEDWQFHDRINSANSADPNVSVTLEFMDKSGNRYILNDEYDRLLEANFLQFQGFDCKVNTRKCIFDISGNPRKFVCNTGPRKDWPLKQPWEPLYPREPFYCRHRVCRCTDHMKMPKALDAAQLRAKFEIEPVTCAQPVQLQRSDILVKQQGRKFCYYINDTGHAVSGD